MRTPAKRRRRLLTSTGLLLVATSLALSLNRPGSAAADSTNYVQPFNPAAFTAGLPTDAASTRARQILLNANKYAVNTWWNVVKNYDATTGYLDLGGTGQNQVRSVASEAYSLAVSLQTGAYDAATTGVSEADARTIAVRLAASVAYRHKTNLGSAGWGYEWQSDAWAGMAGTAGWLLWNDLTTTDREYVRKMVESEVNRYVGYQTPYWRNPAGTLIRPCEDTAAEENAWNTRLLTLASTMMPQHPNRDGWDYKRHELAVSAFARQSDTSSTALVRGRPLKEWLEGYNATEFGAVVNHGFYHPDYATNGEELGGGLVQALAGLPIDKDLGTNMNVVYKGLVDKQWWADQEPKPCASSTRSLLAPGANNPTGTTYVDNSDEIYFPQGNDWGTYRRLHYATMDALIDAYGADTQVTEKASGWEELHASAALAMQQRPMPNGSPSDGSTYRSAGEDTYPRREEAIALQAGMLWLVHWLKHQNAITFTDSTTPIVVDNHDRQFTTGGTWGSAVPSAANPNIFGSDSRFAAPGTGSWARWTPRISTARTFAIYARWEDASAYSPNAKFTIHNASGDTHVYKDQRTGAGSWQLLGNFTLDSSSYVQLSNSTSGYVIADAVKLVPLD